MNFGDPLSVVIDRLDNHADRISRLETLFDILLDLQGLDAELQIKLLDAGNNLFGIRLQNIVFHSNGVEYRFPIGCEMEQVAHHEG